MKAICVNEYGGPEVLRLQEIAELSPGPGQVLVGIHAAGVNPVDTYIRTGWYPIKKTLPYTPGSDGAGIVMQLGSGVESFKPGDRVFVCGSLTGTYAQQSICLPEQLYHLPDHISFQQGAAIGGPYGTAFRALFDKAKAVAGQTVLIHGASGGVGIAAVQLAAAAGLTVIATAGTERGRRLVIEQGASYVLDHFDIGHYEAIRDITQGRGVDIVLEMLANQNLNRDLDIVSINGSIVIIGNRGCVEVDPRKAMTRDLNIMGMMMANTPQQRLKEIYIHLQIELDTGKILPIVGLEYPLKEAALAHRKIIESGHQGKIALFPVHTCPLQNPSDSQSQ